MVIPIIWKMVESAKNESVNVNKNHVTTNHYIYFLLNLCRISWDIVTPGFHILDFDFLFVVSIFSVLNYANICKNKTFLLVVWMLMIPRGLSSVIPLVSSEAHSRFTRMVLPRQLRGITFTYARIENRE
jgi:hypothetical protein